MNDKTERWDRWDTRLPKPKDQQRAIDLFHKSGAETKSDFVRGRILGESFKVIMVDKSAVEYYRKLSELTAQIHKIGVLYNQAVRAINSYHSVKTAQIMLEKLENLSAQIITLQEQAISLTIDYRKNDCQNIYHGKPRRSTRLQLQEGGERGSKHSSCPRLVSKQRGNLYDGRGVCRYASIDTQELPNKKDGVPLFA